MITYCSVSAVLIADQSINLEICLVSVDKHSVLLYAPPFVLAIVLYHML